MTQSVLDRSLGIHQHAVRVRAQRAQVLAANIANADTPNYKAKDIDFQAVLQRSQKRQQSTQSLARTSQRHIDASQFGVPSSDIKYRQALQPALDGNTVDEHVENVQFAENTFRYQASLQFLSGKFKSLRMAIKGE